jgi:hypothetical protein
MTGRQDEPIDEANDELSFKPLLLTLWSYRRVMLAALVVIVVLYAGAMALLFATVPKERLATVGFRLTFQGADQDKFPNGTKFSAVEIVATPVLAEVFKSNQLEQYLGFSDFKDGIFILQANPDLEMLSYEYQAKLADSKLSPVDRSRLEEEFRKKRDTLKSVHYSINIRRTERLLRIPTPLLSKVLQDTLTTWARQAADRKGAVRYDIPVLSKNALRKDDLGTEEYAVAVDVLRSTAERILKTIDEIAKIPGAAATRIGQEQAALADIRINLEDVIRFKLEPLISLIRTNGLARNAAGANEYFSQRLLEVQLAREETGQRIRAIQEAFRAYQQRGVPDATGGSVEGPRSGAVTPQISESFIDRIVDLSSQTRDMSYRQDLTDRVIAEGLRLADLSKEGEYYKSLQRAFAAARAGSAPPLEKEVVERTRGAFDDIARGTDQVQTIYKLISEQNLNPDTVLYSITSPFVVRTTSSLSSQTVMFYFFVMLFAAALILPVSCLAHDYFRHWISPSHPAPDSHPRDTGTGRIAGV